MSGKAFDRVVINPRERPLSTDINTAQSQLDRTLREVLRTMLLCRATALSDGNAAPISGFFGEGLKARPVAPVAMQVRVPAGLGFLNNPSGTLPSIGGISGVDDLAVYAPLILNADATFNVAAAPSAPNTRIDIIEVALNRRLTDTASRDVLNTVSGAFEPQSVQKTLGWDLDASVGVVSAPSNSTAALSYKVGVAANPGVAPATSPGYLKIAEILVGSSVSSIDADVIRDLRKMLYADGMGHVAFNLSSSSVGTPTQTLSDVVAPPGVVVAAVGASITNAEANVYIIGGDMTSVVNPIAAACNRNALTSVQAVTSIVTIDSTIKAALLGANASPVTKVAEGQTAIRVNLKAGTPGNPHQYACAVSFRGGF